MKYFYAAILVLGILCQAFINNEIIQRLRLLEDPDLRREQARDAFLQSDQFDIARSGAIHWDGQEWPYADSLVKKFHLTLEDGDDWAIVKVPGIWPSVHFIEAHPIESAADMPSTLVAVRCPGPGEIELRRTGTRGPVTVEVKVTQRRKHL